tara:strand:+ start:2275 stop:2688 length:414 start_codon:yes stop_codon:yes gene_type:complete
MSTRKTRERKTRNRRTGRTGRNRRTGRGIRHIFNSLKRKTRSQRKRNSSKQQKKKINTTFNTVKIEFNKYLEELKDNGFPDLVEEGEQLQRNNICKSKNANTKLIKNFLEDTKQLLEENAATYLSECTQANSRQGSD